MHYPAKLLNSITMYRLVIYVLVALNLSALAWSYFGFLPYKPLNILSMTAALVIICLLINFVFSILLKVMVNAESTVITALILSLIVGPANPLSNWQLLLSVSSLAIASKYLFAPNARHIFNPAAAGVFLSAVILGHGASWWVGNPYQLPIAILGGILIVIKIKRAVMTLSFIGIYLAILYLTGINPIALIVYSPLVFFTSVMLTEPLTSPNETKKQIAYAAIVGISLITLQKTTSWPYTLELSLLFGNAYAYLAGNPLRVSLKLKHKKKIASGVYLFTFIPQKKVNFEPGQYMEWTLPHKNPDQRGVRRYFSIATSPDEKDISFAVKVPKEESSFKKALLDMPPGGRIAAMDAAGDFTLPEDKDSKLAFIAGGIGITPFISMLAYMLDRKQARDIVLIYSATNNKEVAFRNVIAKASYLNVKTIYHITNEQGLLSAEQVLKYIPDYRDRTFYVSGPQMLVASIAKRLNKIGAKKVKTDYFPGY